MTFMARGPALTMSVFQPNKLVWVRVASAYKEEAYAFVGELMSYPFAGKIKVRCVPGHPGTLQDVEISRISPLLPNQKYRWVQYGIARDEVFAPGFGGFPTDMLRRENASPVNFSLPLDEDGFGRPVIDTSMDFDGLVVAKCTKLKTPFWNIDRWKSFGWDFKHMKTETLSAR